MSKFKIKFRIDAGEPGEDAECMHIIVTMPFVPHKGDFVSVRPGDDHRKVDQVFWHKKDGIEVYLEDSHWSPDDMKKVGWKPD